MRAFCSIAVAIFLRCTLHVLASCYLFVMLSLLGFLRPGQLVWRRLQQSPAPSPHSVRTTCMHLLPLVEMYCRWELHEDCSDLQALLERFDSVSELESHSLGRSLLFMVRDDDDGFRSYAERRHAEAAHPPNADAFDAVRQRLAAVDLAIQGLQPQVHIVVGYVEGCALPSQRDSVLGRDFFSAMQTLSLHFMQGTVVLKFQYNTALAGSSASASLHTWVLPLSECNVWLLWLYVLFRRFWNPSPPSQICALLSFAMHGGFLFRCPSLLCMSVGPALLGCRVHVVRAVCNVSGTHVHCHAQFPGSPCRLQALVVLNRIVHSSLCH